MEGQINGPHCNWKTWMDIIWECIQEKNNKIKRNYDVARTVCSSSMPVKILNVLFLLKQRLHLKHSLCLIADYFISKLCCLVFLFLLKKVESLEIVVIFFFLLLFKYYHIDYYFYWYSPHVDKGRKKPGEDWIEKVLTDRYVCIYMYMLETDVLYFWVVMLE